MILTMLGIIALFIFLGLYLATKYDETLYAFFLVGTLLCFVPQVFISSPPVAEYPYETDITLSGNNYKSTVQFQSFSQKDNIISIEHYAKPAWHWANYKGYDTNDGELKIILTDNNNQFIYTIRETKDTIGKPNYATQ